MKVLITGANGQLGQELAHCLRTGRSELGAIPPEYTGAEVTAADLQELDITRPSDTLEYIGALSPELIFHCAAMTQVDACEGDQETAMRVNAFGARDVARAAQKVGAKLLYVSTDYVFSGQGTSPYAEWDVPAPNTVYGKSKLLGERYVSEQCARSFIVRTAWLYGAAGHNFVRTILRTVEERGTAKVVDDQRGSPTNASDLAHHLLKLALTEQYGVCHCVGRGQCSWYEFACEIVRLAGVAGEITPCSTAEFPRPAPRPAYSVMRNLALDCAVGDEMRDWKDALEGWFARVVT